MPPDALVWVDLDPLVPGWQVDYVHQGVASVARTFAAVEDALRGFCSVRTPTRAASSRLFRPAARRTWSADAR
jgi:hypothetical protein